MSTEQVFKTISKQRDTIESNFHVCFYNFYNHITPKGNNLTSIDLFKRPAD